MPMNCTIGGLASSFVAAAQISRNLRGCIAVSRRARSGTIEQSEINREWNGDSTWAAKCSERKVGHVSASRAAFKVQCHPPARGPPCSCPWGLPSLMKGALLACILWFGTETQVHVGDQMYSPADGGEILCQITKYITAKPAIILEK